MNCQAAIVQSRFKFQVSNSSLSKVNERRAWSNSMIMLFSVALAIALALALASTSLGYAQIPAITLPNGTLLTFNNLTAVKNYYAQKEGKAEC